MALIDQVVNTSPANGDQGVALRATISITLSGEDYDETSLLEGIFLEGPDTDQFVGPGQIDLVYPANVSQGDVDDFFASPGRKGIVQGTTSVSVDAGNTVITFTAALPFAPSTEYTVTLGDVYELDGVTPYSDFVTFSFTSGSGSIVEIPSTISTSPIQNGVLPPDILAVSLTSPVDRSIENNPNTIEIVVTFDRVLDETSLEPDDFVVQIEPVSDHPSVTFDKVDSAPKAITINQNKLTIRV